MQNKDEFQRCVDKIVSQGLGSEEYAKKICSQRKFNATAPESKTCIEQMMDEGNTYEQAKSICKGRKEPLPDEYMGLRAESIQNKEEKLLREFIRETFVSNLLKEQREEHAVRMYVRSLISEVRSEQELRTLFEAKDMANPHPNTGINKLRDAIRKAKPSIKAKYQQLTTDGSQRESFSNHFLTAMVRLFDELDALNAQGKEAEDVASEFGGGESDLGLEAPPDATSDEMAADIEADGDLDALLEAVDVDIQDDPEANDIVSDEFDEKENTEKEKSKTQVEKDFDKKSNINQEREKFGAGVEGDSTGRNQAFDAFNLVQSYFSDAYLDLNNPEDQEMYKKWGLYNIKLLLDKYEEELNSNPEAPNIEDPT